MLDTEELSLALKFLHCLNRIAGAMELANDLTAQRLAKEYPEKGEVKDATVTQRETEEDRLLREQGYDPEATDEEWRGPREKRALEAAARRRTKRTP